MTEICAVELALSIMVPGDPVSPGGKASVPIYRGSKRNNTREFTGRVATFDKKKAVIPWRAAITAAVRKDGLCVIEPLDGPLHVSMYFTLGRPRTVTRVFPTVIPDVDNLVKPTYDALTKGGVWKDDKLIISQFTSKAYVGGSHPDGTPALDHPGVSISIYRILVLPA